MAPTPSTLGNTAQSTLLSSSSIVTPIIVIVSSAAGISSILFVAILVVTSYRRVRAERTTRLKNTIVPRLVITDTSMFPTSNVVVNGESDLDKVIASFKPIGADLHVPEPEYEATAFDVYSPRLGDDEDEQSFPVPKRPKRASDTIVTREPDRSACCNDKDEKVDSDAPCRRRSRSGSIQVTIQPISDPTETDEPVWWYDFRGQESSDSCNSLSEANESISSGSLYSTNSSFYHTSMKLGLPSKSSGSKILAFKDTPGVGAAESGDHPHDVCKHDPIEEVGDESQETLYDKDVLAYCWKISEDNSCTTPRHDERTISENAGRMVPSRSKRRSVRSRESSGAYDQTMPKHCWRLSGSASLKSVREKDDIRSPRICHTSAARSMSEASISGPEISQLQSHDSGYIVFPSQGLPSRRASVR